MVCLRQGAPIISRIAAGRCRGVNQTAGHCLRMLFEIKLGHTPCGCIAAAIAPLVVSVGENSELLSGEQ